MRILDRERYWAFFKAYVICFVSLVGLYIVIDAFTNLDEFLKVCDNTLELFQHMGRFYLIRISFFYDRLCGVITMMAAIFTVTWMTKNNELLAMLAAGVSTRRAVFPVLVSSFLVSVVAMANQEFLIPRIADELQMTHDDDGERPVRAGNRYDLNDIQINGENGNRAEKTVEPFHALLPVSRFGALWSLEAKVARYIPETDLRSPYNGGWLLYGARLSPATAVPDGQLLIAVPADKIARFPALKRDAAPPPGDVYFLRSSVTFTNITRNADWYQFATTPDLVRALGDPSSPSEAVQVGVFLHGRLVRPITSLVLLFLSLPLVLGGEGRNMFINLGLSLGTSGLFYGANFLLGYLGNNQVLSPVLAAWVPIIAFGSWAASRWDMIRT